MKKEKVNIICIWWTPCVRGRSFSIPDIQRLQKNVDRWIDREYDFYCLTNYEGHLPQPIKKIQMHHSWPGWWGKMELYRLDMPPGRTLYIDQDTYVVDSLSAVLDYSGDFVLFRNRNRKNIEKTVLRYQAGIMLFDSGQWGWVYSKFRQDAPRYMKTFRGDQDVLGYWLPDQPMFPDHWMIKAGRVPLKKPKECIFVTGQPQNINYKELPNKIKWIQNRI